MRGTGGGVPSNMGMLMGRPGVLTGAGIPVGGRLASAAPSEERLPERRIPLGVLLDTLIASGCAFGNCLLGGGGPRPSVRWAEREDGRDDVADTEDESACCNVGVGDRM